MLSYVETLHQIAGIRRRALDIGAVVAVCAAFLLFGLMFVTMIADVLLAFIGAYR